MENKSFEEFRKEWELNIQERNIKSEISDLSADICILCGKESPYPIELDISLRHCYIESKGQLCLDCCKKFNDRRL